MDIAEWIFGSPYLDPRSFSLVVRSNDGGYSCYTEGNNNIFLPTAATQGYGDGK